MIRDASKRSRRKTHEVKSHGSSLYAPCSLRFALPVTAQQAGKIFRIGFLDPSTASGIAVLLEAFRQELTQAWMD